MLPPKFVSRCTSRFYHRFPLVLAHCPLLFSLLRLWAWPQLVFPFLQVVVVASLLFPICPSSPSPLSTFSSAPHLPSSSAPTSPSVLPQPYIFRSWSCKCWRWSPPLSFGWRKSRYFSLGIQRRSQRRSRCFLSAGWWSWECRRSGFSQSLDLIIYLNELKNR